MSSDIRDLAEVRALVSSQKCKSQSAAARMIAEQRGLSPKSARAYAERLRRQAIRLNSQNETQGAANG